jgi:magnesium chelatase subunit I
MTRPSTVGELKASGWTSRSVKAEMRANLVARLRAGEPVFQGLVGYDRTVVPQLQNALLSHHDFILLGLRGQAKTRILRSLSVLLDDVIPVLEGSELNDDPLAPISAWGQRQVEQLGDAAPVAWLDRADRYREKLATPDVTISDLIGDIDPIKAATHKLAFSDEGVIHYGIIPRTNRGIFAINELPDLQARIQVGLLNILEEGDIQIRGFPVRLPMDVVLVFSANPEDYTNRGNIITPLRDRIASQIMTHYPRSLEDGMAITGQEAWVQREGEVEVEVADWMRELVEHVAFEARGSEFVDQNSGVSARMTISLMENLVSNAERRGLSTGSERVTARVSDLFGATSAITGKVELVYEGEREGVAEVASHLVGRAVKMVFDARFPDAYAQHAPEQPRAKKAGRQPPGVGGVAPGQGGPAEETPTEYTDVLDHFRSGATVDVSDTLSCADLLARLRAVDGLEDLARRHLEPSDDEALAAGMELALEGLHQNSLLSRQELVHGRVYRDPFDEMGQNLRD